MSCHHTVFVRYFLSNFDKAEVNVTYMKPSPSNDDEELFLVPPTKGRRGRGCMWLKKSQSQSAQGAGTGLVDRHTRKKSFSQSACY